MASFSSVNGFLLTSDSTASESIFLTSRVETSSIESGLPYRCDHIMNHTLQHTFHSSLAYVQGSA